MSNLNEQIQSIARKVQEPMGLDRWNLHLLVEPIEDGRANCDPSPEYREAYVRFDFDKLITGDDVNELVVHELTHCLTAPIVEAAWRLAQCQASSAPEHLREPLRILLERWVEIETERVTTDIGHVILKLLRRSAILEAPSNA